MFFDKTHDDQHPARNVALPLPPPILPVTEEQTRAKKAIEREERKSELEYKIVCARLDNELATLKKQREMLKTRTPREILRDDFEQHDTHFMAVHRIASDKLKSYQQDFADDPELLEMAKMSVEKWKIRHT